jgi:alpha-glucosidase
VSGDGYPEFARQAFHLVLHGAAPSTVSVDGSDVGPTDGGFRVEVAAAGFTARFTAS